MPRDNFDRLRGKPPEERALNWLNYDHYTFLVYPQVRPNDPNGERVMYENIARMRRKLQSLVVLGGLTNTQQNAFAALVLDFQVDADMYQNYARSQEFVRVNKLLGKRDLRKLTKVTEILQGLTRKLSNREIERLNWAIENGLARKESPVRDPHPYATRLGSIENALRALSADIAAKLDLKTYKEWMGAHFPITFDSKIEASKQSYWFLVEKCGLAKNEAEVRVAKIATEIFEGKVSYRERYEGDDRWKGSTTIRQRIVQKSRSRPISGSRSQETLTRTKRPPVSKAPRPRRDSAKSLLRKAVTPVQA